MYLNLSCTDNDDDEIHFHGNTSYGQHRPLNYTTKDAMQYKIKKESDGYNNQFNHLNDDRSRKVFSSQS